MRIACLGWGSLIRHPKTLPVLGQWSPDGPLLPVEFARVSKGRRVTLVLLEGAREIQTWWVLLSVPDLKTAVEELRKREDCNASDIGYWSRSGEFLDTGFERKESWERAVVKAISAWVEQARLDAVVWTALPAKGFDNPELPCFPDHVVAYLRALTGEERRGAEDYIREAPAQTDTIVRRKIEAELGWTPRGLRDGPP
jgi:hypothetical protein